MLRRRMMMQSGGSGRLPKEYREVEYLQSENNAFIVTLVNYEIGSEYLIELEIQSLEYTNNVGCGWNAGGAVFINQKCWANGSGTNSGINAAIKTNVSINIKNGTSYYIYKSEDVIVTDSRSNSSLYLYASGGYPLFCSTRYPATPYDWGHVRAKIYSAKISKNGLCVCDVIPCYRKSDNEPGMYDIVNGVFYTNQGNGKFIVGKDVN